MSREINYVIKADDSQAIAAIDRVHKRASLADQIRQGADIGGFGGVKGAAKNIGEFFGMGGNVRESADKLRAEAAAAYARDAKAALAVEREAATMDKVRLGAMRERADAALTLKRQLAEINASEKQQIQAAMKSGLLAGEYGPAEIKEEAAISRAAAEKAYQDVLERTVNVQLQAAKSDEERRKAMLAKAEAGRKYAEQLREIAQAEQQALKASSSAGGLARGLGIAGAAVAVVGVVSKVAEAADKANQKLEEGKIKTSEWGLEMMRELPLGIGAFTKAAESAGFIISGLASETRKLNREAASLDAVIAARNAKRQEGRDAIDAAVAGTEGLNDTEAQRINREAAAKLKQIRDARQQGKDSISLDDGRSIKLDTAEANVIRKRESDLAKVEAAEREKRARQIEAVEDRLESASNVLADERTRGRIERLKAEGKEVEATILEIQTNADQKRRELDAERAKLEREGGLSDAQRTALNDSIDARKAAVTQAERETLESARIAAQRRLDEERAKAAEDGKVETTETIMRGRNAMAVDARFNAGAYGASRQVDIIRDEVKAAKDTAKNTADSVKVQQTMLKQIELLTQRLNVVRLS